MLDQNQKYSETYFYYHRIGDQAYREKVRFYEENPKVISSLSYEERIEIDIDYCICLFEIGRYQRFLDRVDPIIEIVIEENIYEYNHENIFNDLLLKKAACYYNLRLYNQALKILSQLIKIDANIVVANKLYGMCKRKQESDIIITLKAIAMSGLLMAISITVARIFLIEPFYDQYLAPFVMIRNIILLLSFCAFFSIEIYHSYSVYKETGMVTSPIFKWIINLFSKRN